MFELQAKLSHPTTATYAMASQHPHHHLNIAPRTESPASFPQYPAQPLRLVNPTEYHLQQTYKAQAQTGAVAHPVNTIDPNLLNLSQTPSPIKQDDPMEPTDPFSLQTEFELGNTSQPSPHPNNETSSATNNNNNTSNTNIMSPLSSSPLDASPDFETGDDFTPRGSGSLNDSPYGTSPFSAQNDEMLFDQMRRQHAQHQHQMPGSHHPHHPHAHQHVGSNPIEMKGRHFAHLAGAGGAGGFYSMSMPVHGTGGFGALDHKMTGAGPSSFGAYPSSGSFGMDDVGSLEDGEGGKQLEILNEKRRRRRESHNAVERRRRDNINEKIHELSTLLPEVPSDGANKPNKGVILRRSVDYIRQAHRVMQMQSDRVKELESILRRMCLEKGVDERELGLSVPLGEGMAAFAPSSASPSSSTSPAAAVLSAGGGPGMGPTGGLLPTPTSAGAGMGGGGGTLSALSATSSVSSGATLVREGGGGVDSMNVG